MHSSNRIVAIDLFCGAGGLTYGLQSAGIDVKLGIDIDSACAHPIETNSNAKFLKADIATLDTSVIEDSFAGAEYKLLAGCAPCQPFSTYSRAAKQRHGEGAGSGRSDDWRLVSHFAELVRKMSPDFVTMENVAPLAIQDIFQEFLANLNGYWTDWRVVECSKIGLPQARKRLVLVASRLGPISIPNFNAAVSTVRSTIGKLPPIAAGDCDPTDRLHRASRLSALNLERIKCSVPGGTWRDWPEHLRSTCHSKISGATYPSVYGRMQWDTPAPTVTTQCFGYGNGRFGHPEQNRAISLREAAMLQGFPRDYSFVPQHEPVSFAKVGRLIGNAVPVTLGKKIGEIFQDHIKNFGKAALKTTCK